MITANTTTTTSLDLTGSMTQVFTVQCPQGAGGIYATRIDLYFSKISSSYGAELSIVNVTNGLPDVSSVVPDSTVTLTSDLVHASANASVATPFRFNRPIFLLDGQSYAFTIRALGNSPDYLIWRAINGDTDVSTGISVTPSPLSGASYYAKTSSSWSEIPNSDIKYTIWRASFNTSSPSVAMLRQGNREIMSLGAFAYASGEIDIRAGDEVFGLIDGIANTNYYAVVVSFDYENNMLYLSTSSGNFAANQQIVIARTAAAQSLVGAGMLGMGTIGALIDYPMHAIVPKVGLINSLQSTIDIQYQGTYKTGGPPAVAVKEANSWISLTDNNETQFYDKTRYVLSHSNEVASLSGNSSVDIQVTMTSNTDYSSPMIDLNSKSIIGIRNLINSNTSGEQGAYGAALTRYISKVVTLADGQNPEDLQVWITAYKPPGTQISVYCKLWNSEDPDTFDSKPWTLMIQSTNPDYYSTMNDQTDFIEYEYVLPNTPPVAGAAYSPLIIDIVDGDPVQYITSNGTFVDFQQYSLKVVCSVTNDATAYVYPILNDLRSIALQK